MACSTRARGLQLAKQVQRLTDLLIAEWEQHDEEHAPFEAPRWNEVTTELEDATDELLNVVIGPRVFFRQFQLRHFDLVAFQVAFEFHLFDHVPTSGDISLSKLAQLAGLDEDRLGRIMRLLVVHGVFGEPEENMFTHTPRSELMAKDRAFQSSVACQMDEMYQAASSTSDALRKEPYKQSVDVTGFSARFGMSIYEFYKTDSRRAERFGRAMEGSTAFDAESMESLRDCYDWGAFENGTIVDVGGGAGHVSLFLAKHFPRLSFIVQDLFPPPTLDSGNKLATNVQFQQHNFFESQPVTTAQAYFMKHSLHNHSDSDCIKILQCLVPALESAGPNTPLLINEGVVPAVGEAMPRHQELTLRRGDMCMLVTLSGKERTRLQFQQLLSAADRRLEITNIYGTAVTKLIEVRLRF
ncbi:S-adenosyl-L-methionine-dependent methyltransferase [Aspergillus floccosus]